MVIHKGSASQPALPWLFALLAVGGVLVFLSWWAFLLVAHLSDMGPSEELVLVWAIIGFLGLAAALVFGTMALLTLGWAGPKTAIPARRLGLWFLATLCVVAALFFIGQRYAVIPAIILLLVAGFALQRLRQHR